MRAFPHDPIEDRIQPRDPPVLTFNPAEFHADDPTRIASSATT
jgi:hypothetical protein